MRDDSYSRSTNVNKCWYKDMCEHYGTDRCIPTCRKFTQTDYLFKLSNLPRSYWKSQRLLMDEMEPECADTLQTIISDCEFFVKKGFNMYLYGEPGCGKTSWAVKVLNNYIAAIAETNDFTPRVFFINVASFLRDAKLHMTYKSEDYLEALRTIQNCDLVVWDDVCQTNPTNYESQWLYSFINERLMAKKSNIFTSNLSPEQLETVDKRLASRICQGSDCVHITGPDLRYTQTYTYYMNSSEVEDNDTDSDA